MALFGGRKSPIDDLWEAYKKLPDEDRKSFKAKLEDIDKAEDEREIDKIEEDKAESSEKRDEKREEVKEESEEIGKDVDEAERKEKRGAGEDYESDKDSISDAVKEEVDKGNQLEERGEDIFKGLDSRLKAIEDIVLHTSDRTQNVDAGISGYGRYKQESIKDDTRMDDTIKALGGRV